jgi:phage-related protein
MSQQPIIPSGPFPNVRPSKAYLMDAWKDYCTRNKINLIPTQQTVVEHLMDLISDDEEVSRFFVARLTGVSFVLHHFERFCRDPSA